MRRLEEEGAQIHGADEQRGLAGADRRGQGARHPRHARRRRAGTPARAGRRPLGELLEPGALRQGDTLPWALQVDYNHCPDTDKDLANTTCNLTYHPTFLYEFIWDLAGVGLLLWLDRGSASAPPALFALYVSYYTFGRFFEELLRIDPSGHFLGLRLNAWVSVVVFLASSGFFVWWQILQPRSARKRRRERAAAAGDGRAARPPVSQSETGARVPRVAVRELELDLDAFEGPFDLLLTLVLRDELDLAEVDVAGIVVAFVQRLAERDRARPRRRAASSSSSSRRCSS